MKTIFTRRPDLIQEPKIRNLEVIYKPVGIVIRDSLMV